MLNFETMIGRIFLFGLMLLAVVQCKEDDGIVPMPPAPNQRAIDSELIQEYVMENGLDADSTGSGLHYVIEQEGNGDHPNLQSRITINYTGTLLNGDQFDSSNGNPVTFKLDNLIEGWKEGIPYFSEEGAGLLLIPSHLAYGSSTLGGSIPSNSVLVFEIELLEVD